MNPSPLGYILVGLRFCQEYLLIVFSKFVILDYLLPLLQGEFLIIEPTLHFLKLSFERYYCQSSAIPRQIEKVRRWQPFLLGTKLLGMDIAQRLEYQLLGAPSNYARQYNGAGKSRAVTDYS